MYFIADPLQAKLKELANDLTKAQNSLADKDVQIAELSKLTPKQTTQMYSDADYMNVYTELAREKILNARLKDLIEGVKGEMTVSINKRDEHIKHLKDRIDVKDIKYSQLRDKLAKKYHQLDLMQSEYFALLEENKLAELYEDYQENLNGHLAGLPAVAAMVEAFMTEDHIALQDKFKLLFDAKKDLEDYLTT